MLKGGYSFEKYSVALPYKGGDKILNGSCNKWTMKPKPLIMPCSHMALASQNGSYELKVPDSYFDLQHTGTLKKNLG